MHLIKYLTGVVWIWRPVLTWLMEIQIWLKNSRPDAEFICPWCMCFMIFLYHSNMLQYFCSCLQEVFCLSFFHLCLSADFDAEFFWKWSTFEDYVQFLAVFTCVIGVLTVALRNNSIYVEGLGLAALMTEALLAAPQFWHNYQSKSTEGMRWDRSQQWL